MLLLHVENTTPSHTLPRSGASHHRILDSYENTDF